MKVKELIEELQKFDSEKIVCVMKTDLLDDYYQDGIGYLQEKDNIVEIY